MSLAVVAVNLLVAQDLQGQAADVFDPFIVRAHQFRVFDAVVDDGLQVAKEFILVLDAQGQQAVQEAAHWRQVLDQRSIFFGQP